MPKGKRCDKPGCKGIQRLVDALFELVNGEHQNDQDDNAQFLVGPPEGGNGDKGEETIEEISGLLMEVMIKNLDGNIDLDKISQVKLQGQKILIDLERLTIYLRQANASDDERQNITKDMQREMKRFLEIIFEC